MKQKAQSRIEWCGGFAPILILLIIVAIGVAGYFANKYSCRLRDVPCVQTLPPRMQTPNDQIDVISNWKTYTNAKYGFSFKYPAVYTVLGESPSSFAVAHPQKSDCCDYDFILNMQVNENKFEDSVDNYYYREYCDNITKSAYTPNVAESIRQCKSDFNSVKTKLLVDGRQAIRSMGTYYLSEFPITVIDNHDYFIVFRLETGQEEGSVAGEKENTILDQILSTFKFIDDSVSPKPTCIPRPTCLDATPKCMIPETTDMCLPAKVCGGIAGLTCPDGHECKITETYPDAMGSCVSK